MDRSICQIIHIVCVTFFYPTATLNVYFGCYVLFFWIIIIFTMLRNARKKLENWQNERTNEIKNKLHFERLCDRIKFSNVTAISCDMPIIITSTFLTLNSNAEMPINVEFCMLIIPKTC